MLWKAIVRGLLILSFSTLALMTQVSAEQAVSNLYSWSSFAHLDKLTPLLSGPHVDQVVFWLAVLGICAVIASIIWPWIRRRGSRNDVMRPSGKRVELREVVAEARRLGWDFGETSTQILDLADGLRQAATDGDVTLWGRRTGGALTRLEPLVRIPPEHWERYSIDAISMRSLDNFEISTYIMGVGGKGGFVDLHANSAEATAWLQEEASKFKGRNRSIV